MTTAVLWGRLPLELRQLNQWVVAGPDKQPLACGASGFYSASVTDPSTWCSFEQAAHAAYAHGYGIGFVLTENDPYTCIDLDVKDSSNEQDPNKCTSQDQFNRFWKIAQAFDSYTETSRSGKGLHIWVRARIGTGVRRDGVEMYSQERYLISTGNILFDRPIRDRQELADVLARELRGPKPEAVVELVEEEPVEEDAVIWERARTAENASKFLDLCNGKWHDKGFPSQSEADLALMSMFTFYSKSNEQCRRMFRQTVLGQRDKAQRNNKYLDFTLQTIRTREALGLKVEIHGDFEANCYIAQVNAQARRKDIQVTALHVPGQHFEVTPAPPSVAVALAAPVAAPVAAVADTGLPWPPGLTGAIAGFIYQSAPRPVKEVAIVAALGLLAGMCGKLYSIPQSGLNVYIILVARSAIGKEAMHSGVSTLLGAAVSRCPQIMNFVDFSDFASGPALVKAVASNASFVNIAGEIGRKLKRMAQEDGRDGPLASLRTAMTNLYQKSGPQAIVGGITYSNKESNISSVNGVSFSLIGETTPSTFYESLTESMMEDGFLSRFTVVEYDGDRPPLNHHQLLQPNKALGDAVGDIAHYAYTQNLTGQTVHVGRTDKAAELLWSFELECDEQINGTKDESWRQMWNRASLKVLRIAALLSVADNYLTPVVSVEHVEWALTVIRRDIALMRKHIESGDVGAGDHVRERKLASIIREYLVLTNNIPESYNIKKAMRENGIVPRSYLQTRTSRLASFTSHKLGANAALDHTIRGFVDNGYMMDVDKAKAVDVYSHHGKCYRVLNLPDGR